MTFGGQSGLNEADRKFTLIMLQLITGLVLVIFLLVFFIYGSLTVKHAARFRHLSRRTVYTTVAFTSLSGALIALALILYAMLLF